MDIREIIRGRAAGLGEKVYVAPNIPKDKLKNAVEGIADNACTEESVVAVLDTTVFGVCDNGLVFTDDAMYFSALMEKTVCVRYDDVGSARSSGVVLKELVIVGPHGNVIRKIDAEDFKASVAADILNSIAAAREEAVRESERASNGMASVIDDDSSDECVPADFEKARKKIKSTARALIVVGVILMFCALWWWGLAAIIIGIELLGKFRKDATLQSDGMPVSVYCADTKELIQQAWIGTVIVLGVFGVPSFCGKCRKRIATIRRLLANLSAMGEERLITLYTQSFGEKDDQARPFVHRYVDGLEQQGKVVRVDVGGRMYIFDPDHLEKVMERMDSLAKSDIRVPRIQLIGGVKELFDEDEQTVEALINVPETGIESYTFADGAYYVHGVNDDRVRVCSVCGIAEIVTPDGAAEEGSAWFCSDYCRETDEECEKLIAKLRADRFARDGVDAAAFGGSLHGILSSVSYNKGNVAARSHIVRDPVTGVETSVHTGHGVAAENANTRIDKLMGRSAQVVGGDNAKDGADRIVNGVKIQCKYCQSARQSVNAAFADKGQGSYRYVDADGKAMQLEVPRNQYEEAVAEMRKKFHEGKLPPDVKTEADAEKLVRKGHLTYKQAQNICKFGTIESLAYDAYTGAIVGVAAGGISFVLTTALSYYKTKDLKKAVRASVGAGLQTGGKAFAVYVLTAQVQRTEFVKAFLHESVMDVNFGAHGKFVERIGKGLSKMSGAKSGTFTKNANVAVKGAVVTAVATFAVTSVWEVGKLCCGRMSGMQCLKNIAVSGGGITVGTAGALIGGALMAPIPGGVFIGGLLGGAVGGMLGGGAVKAGMDKLIDDDSIAVMALVSDEFKLIAASFCMNADEIKLATEELDALVTESKSFVEDVYSKKKNSRHYVARLLRPIFIRICMARPLLRDKDISPDAIASAIEAA